MATISERVYYNHPLSSTMKPCFSCKKKPERGSKGLRSKIHASVQERETSFRCRPQDQGDWSGKGCLSYTHVQNNLQFNLSSYSLEMILSLQNSCGQAQYHQTALQRAGAGLGLK